MEFVVCSALRCTLGVIHLSWPPTATKVSQDTQSLCDATVIYNVSYGSACALGEDLGNHREACHETHRTHRTHGTHRTHRPARKLVSGTHS